MENAMDALIIAAGYGMRLRDVSQSKPLATIAGTPLIELGVRQAVEAGVKRVVVVTGHKAVELEMALSKLAVKLGIEIVAERLNDWSRPNGFSVVAGASKIEGDYLLMMADHLFAAPILKRLSESGGANRGVTLAIDKRTDSELIDADDATWVETDAEGRIKAIGKSLERYDAVDCGAFLATPDLAEAIEAAAAEGKPGSLSDGVQRLAEAGRAFTLDIGNDPEGSWWLDIDDARAHALAEAEAPRRLASLYA
jgi:1L-myo-inositol 1-phosphate cytidylyltransferase